VTTSQEAKAGITPVDRPAPREKAPSQLKRSQMKRRPSKLKRGPVGHASPQQRVKVEAQGCRVTAARPAESYVVDPAHIVSRALGGCDHVDCVVGLRRDLHIKYDEGKLDLLPLLTLDEQSHAAKHLGLLGALKRTTGENYVPEREA
jgi:hypothetical protein